MELFFSASIQGNTFEDASVYFVLLMAMVLIFIGDMSKSRAVLAIIASVVLLYYPFHEYYLYTKYDLNTCHIMAGFLSMPVMVAYTVFGAAESQESKQGTVKSGIVGHRYVWLAVLLGLFVFLLACSMDSPSLGQFK